jgi:hypothetical protein
VLVAYICNPSYMGGRDWKHQGLRQTRGKKVQETPFQPIAGYSGLRLSSQTMQEAEIGKIVIPGQAR